MSDAQNEVETKKFAFIVGEDVFMTLSFPMNHPGSEQWVAGLSSQPIVVEVPEEIRNEVDSSWTWNGSQLVRPTR